MGTRKVETKKASGQNRSPSFGMGLFVLLVAFGGGSVLGRGLFRFRGFRGLFDDFSLFRLVFVAREIPVFAKELDLEVMRNNKHLGITLHTLKTGEKIAVAVNYSGEKITDTVTVKNKNVGKVYLGSANGNEITVEPYSATIFEI